MKAPVELVPLRCVRCSTPVPAEAEEVAWVCARCGQGQLLDEAQGVKPLQIHFAAGIPNGARGRPFWVVEARVGLARETYRAVFGGSSGEAERFWGEPKRFFIPAFACPLDDLLALGARLVQEPPVLEPGPPAPFEPVILDPADLHPLAEFIVLSVEAGRRDQLKKVDVSVALGDPELWILP